LCRAGGRAGARRHHATPSCPAGSRAT
jgi:hypothetical protein